MEKDAIITQDIKIFQQIVKAAIDSGGDGKIAIINVGQIQIVQPTTKKIDASNSVALLEAGDADPLDLMIQLFNYLGEPWIKHLMKLAVKAATVKYGSSVAAAKASGKTRKTLYNYLVD